MDRKRDSVVDKFSPPLRTVCVLNLSLTNAYRALTNTYRRPYQHLPNEYRALFRHSPTLTGHFSSTYLILTNTYRTNIGRFSGTYHGRHCTLFCTLLSHFAHFPAHYGHTLVTLPSHPVTPCTLFCTLLTILIYSLQAYQYIISVQKAYIYTC